MDTQQQKMAQTRGQRVTLAVVLGYNALSALLGGGMLVAAPDGRLMKMPVDIMHGVFADFLAPGIILTGLGILNVAAFFAVLRKTRTDWLLAGLALGGLGVWFVVEIAILRVLVWLHFVWGLPVYLGAFVAVPLIPSRYATTEGFMLICGILASVLYAAMTVFVPLQWPGYSASSQVISELSAIGATTRALWVWLGIPYTLLMIVFGWGVWKTAGQWTTAGHTPLRVAGGLLIVYAGLGVLWPFAPMHLRETLAAGGATLSDTMHIVLGVVTEVLYLLALGFAAAALGKPFRIYSLVTFAVVLVFGVLTFRDAPQIAVAGARSMIGVWERINIGVFLLWVVVLAVDLMRPRSPGPAFEERYFGRT